MSAKFEIYSGKNGQFYFRLKAGNGEVVLSSEGYTTKASCEKGVASVQKNSSEDAQYDRLTAKDGSPYFTLKAANHQVIGHSEMYRSTQARDKGVESVKKNGATTVITDMTSS